MPFSRSLALGLFAALLTAAPFAGAEWHPAEERSGRKVDQARPENRSDRLTRELKLTPDQRAKMEAALKEKQRKMDALHEDFRLKREAVRKETDQKILATLSPEQKEKYEEIQRQKLVENVKRMSKKPQKKQ